MTPTTYQGLNGDPEPGTRPEDGMGHLPGSLVGSVELPDAVQAVAARMDVEALGVFVFQRCRDLIFSAHAGDSEFLDSLRASIDQNACALRDVIAGTDKLEDLHLEDVLSFASVQARLRIPQRLMQRSYRVSFYTQWEAWSDALRQRLLADGVAADYALDAHHSLTAVILKYQDHVASQVADIYTREFDALSQSRSHLRQSLVRGLLEERREHRLMASDLAILDYPLGHQHLAILLPEVAEGAASQVADGLRKATRGNRTLIYPLSLTSSIIWIGRIESWRPAVLDALGDVLDRLGVLATVSQPQVGAEGFRAAYDQAVLAEGVRASWRTSDPEGAPRVVRYADAGLEILMLQDHQLAKAFVYTELGDLAGSTTEAGKLRETLEASFRFGSHVATAEHLGLHEHTIRNRLQRAEEILGHRLQDRRTELQVALRVLRLLGD